MPVLQIDKVDWKILQQILNKYPYEFYAYGSRAKVTAKKYSDLDLCYYDVPNLVIGDIREELEKSDLPFVVELVNWKNMRPAFQKNIEKDLVLISAPTKNKKTKKIKKNDRRN